MKISSKFFTILMIIIFTALSAVVLTKTSTAGTDSSSIDTQKSTRKHHVFSLAYLSLRLTTFSYYAGCAIADTSKPGQGKGMWEDVIALCPKNSIQGTSFTISPTQLQDCVCNRKSNCATSNNDVKLSSYGNFGVKAATIMCFVPVVVWMPYESLGNQAGPAKLNGKDVWINFYGTMPLVQPNKDTDVFAIEFYAGSNPGVGDNVFKGPNFELMKSILKPEFLQRQAYQFPGCGNITGATGC